MADLILKNANIVLKDRVVHGSIEIRDGIITSVDEGKCMLPEAIDCEEDYVIPGLIELHTDNIERHLMPRPKSYWPIDAAIHNHDRELASVGITTVFNAICVGDVNARSLRLQVLEELCSGVLKQQSSGTLKIDHYIHLRCEISHGELLSLLDPLINLDRIKLMSVMDHTPGQRQFVDVSRYADYYQGKFGMTDDELETFMNERRADQEKYSLSNRQAVVERAQKFNIALASHDDATKEHVDEAIDDKIVIAEFPTTLEAAKASHDAGLAVLMGGPNIVRGQSHSGNISARDLAGHGLLDIISSDYVPSSLLYSAIILSDKVEGISLPDAVNMVTSIPAKAIGMEDRGEIKAGKKADILRFRKTDGAPILFDVWRDGAKIA